jgi:hypothetical protein
MFYYKKDLIQVPDEFYRYATILSMSMLISNIITLLSDYGDEPSF